MKVNLRHVCNEVRYGTVRYGTVQYYVRLSGSHRVCAGGSRRDVFIRVQELKFSCSPICMK